MNETTSPEIEWMLDEVPVLCQARGCERVPETWCPLCTQFLCAEHDELTPRRRHDCLGEPADDE